MSINDLLSDIQDDLARVEENILGHLNTEIPLLNEVAQYILASGGKRLRPAILVLASRLFNFNGEAVYQAAGAIEYLHTATLLHDDVVDDADLRRARPAARKIWGNQASVLVGDYLLATAFRTLTLQGNLPVLDTISWTTSLMAKGEILQLIRQYDSATEAEYLDIIIHKTACLFAAAAKIGAVFGGARPEEQQALYDYGNEIGIAFQIIDDALDYAEEREKIGKPLGMDLKERKVTLPLSRLLKVAKPSERAVLDAVLQKESIDDEDVLTVVGMMRDHEVLPYTLGEARKFVEKGKSKLAMLPELPERQTLTELADFVVDREL
ncbi:MAG: polyprenyl synthetase family protein [SAR324 cluster bacterium]|nr:polyprenyl synthetase family protein [SAR324 cluster bacterium]MCZ6842161.1 polyprenyl synthetase family protein [SAR324 cluster bacterium]